MPTIQEVIARVTADGKVTRQDWEQELRPLAETLPRLASAETRALLELWGSDTIGFERGARNGLNAFLVSAGYSMPAPRDLGFPPSSTSPAPGAKLTSIRYSNVGDVDDIFENLSRLSGRVDSTINIAVLDGGFDVRHPALQSKLWTNPCEIPGNGEDDDGNGLVDDIHGWNFVEGNGTLGLPPPPTPGTTVEPELRPDPYGLAGSDPASPARPAAPAPRPGGISIPGIGTLPGFDLPGFGGIDLPGLLGGLNPRSFAGLFMPTDNREEHGTHTIGLATRGTDRIKAMAMRVFSPLDADNVEAAFDYAAANGARVVSMSFKVTGEEDVRIVVEAMKRHPGILFFKSAGNDGKPLGHDFYGPDRYLAAAQLPNLVIVAASDADGRPSDYTNFGAPYATIAARGTAVLSLAPGGNYQPLDGTSMSTPTMASIASKAMLLCPSLRPEDVRQLFIDTAEPMDAWKDKVVSGGLVNRSLCLKTAALIGLVRGGKTPEEAARQLELSPEETTRVLKIVPKYVVSPAAVAAIAGAAATAALGGPLAALTPAVAPR